MNGYVGYLAGSTGDAKVDGPGSSWTTYNTVNDFDVGYGGTGTLEITNGGKVNNITTYGVIIGNNSTSHGTLTVDGYGGARL